MLGIIFEIIEVVKFVKSKGVYVVVLINEFILFLVYSVDIFIKYEWGNDIDVFEINLGVLYQFVFGFLYVVEKNDKFVKLVISLENLQFVYEKVLEYEVSNVRKFVEFYKFELVIYIMVSGLNYGVVYLFSICILMEMQWIYFYVIYVGEYFYGLFEIIDENVLFIILVGLDEMRFLEECVLLFFK